MGSVCMPTIAPSRKVVRDVQQVKVIRRVGAIDLETDVNRFLSTLPSEDVVDVALNVLGGIDGGLYVGIVRYRSTITEPTQGTRCPRCGSEEPDPECFECGYLFGKGTAA